MDTMLQFFINCGPTTCVSATGNACRFLGTVNLGVAPLCLLFHEEEVHDQYGILKMVHYHLSCDDRGRTLRCSECLKADIHNREVVKNFPDLVEAARVQALAGLEWYIIRWPWEDRPICLYSTKSERWFTEGDYLNLGNLPDPKVSTDRAELSDIQKVSDALMEKHPQATDFFRPVDLTKNPNRLLTDPRLFSDWREPAAIRALVGEETWKAIVYPDGMGRLGLYSQTTDKWFTEQDYLNIQMQEADK